ncbi:hypothetical protein GCM10027590_21000 [Nocardiopsis nanhaiensis]
MTSPLDPLQPNDPRHLVGTGGQGTVYLASEPDGTRVAVKALNPERMADPEVRRRFEWEAEAARRVASFCTAAVLEADFTATPAYIASEYVEGATLHRTVTSQGPITGGDLHRLAVSVATALVAVHEAGIVHRDLKPGNVLMAPGGPRVIDFGIAQITEGAGTLTQSAIGTPGFMAPRTDRRRPGHPRHRRVRLGRGDGVRGDRSGALRRGDGSRCAAQGAQRRPGPGRPTGHAAFPGFGGAHQGACRPTIVTGHPPPALGPETGTAGGSGEGGGSLRAPSDGRGSGERSRSDPGGRCWKRCPLGAAVETRNPAASRGVGGRGAGSRPGHRGRRTPDHRAEPVRRGRIRTEPELPGVRS